MNSQANTSTIYEPIRQAFPALKTKAWHFRIHPYYTKQPSNVVGEYIRHFCPENGLVVDPFCGSGVTAIEVLTNKRRTVCLDIDPLACFITRQTCVAPVDTDAFAGEFDRIKAAMNDTVEFVRSASKKKIDDYNIITWYPRDIKLPSNSDRSYVENLFYKDNLIVLSQLLHEIKKIDTVELRDLMLFAFSGILHRASLTFIKWEGSGGHSTIFQQYRYYVPKKPGKLDVWGLFERKCNSLRKIKQISNQIIDDVFEEGEAFKVFCDSAENLANYVQKDSVDYIFTDPPYGAHISYLDLSTMYHAWLGFDVTEENRKREAIEGGELHFDEAHYLEVLQKSFEQMFYVLKENAWLSLVFMHKKTSLWYSIRDMMRYIGFKYVNTVVQPLSWASWHKKSNPLRVLGESLIVNLQKSATRKIIVPMSLPLANIIKNVAERVIYKSGGATTEEILREVIPDLFENDMFIDAASKKISDIISIMESDFDLDKNDLWQIRSESKLGNFIPPEIRIKYYLLGYLGKVRIASFDDIVTTILPLLINGHDPTRDDIAKVLNEVGISKDGIHWEIKDPNNINKQVGFQFDIAERPEEKISIEVPESTHHNQHIYRLAMLCREAGLVPYIGKNESRDPIFRGMKPLTIINTNANEIDQKRIEQIDLIWATVNAVPVWAFEIEEHTSILSALERFTSLLKVCPELGIERRLTIVAPKSRRRKLHQELTTSSYIGHPLYIENKISYMYSDDLVDKFKKLMHQKEFDEADLERLCKIIKPQKEY